MGTVNQRKRRQNETPSKSSQANLAEPWNQLFQPRVLSDVAVHVGKQKEVKNWINGVFSNVVSNGNDVSNGTKKVNDGKISRIALLTGPAGSGKTTLLKLLCQENRIEVVEFSTDQMQISDVKRDDNKGSSGGKPEIDQSQLNQFKDFIFNQNRRKIGIFHSTDAESNARGRKVILIEDFPNGFYLHTKEYHDVLRKMNTCFKVNCVPLVFIISENGESSESLIEGASRSKSTYFSLFPAKLIAELNITQIKFNPVAATIINKALKKLPKYNLFSKEDINHVCSLGDIRSAFNSLELNYCHLPSLPQALPLNNKRPRMQLLTENASNSQDSQNGDSLMDTTLAKSLNSINLRDRLDTSFHYIGKIIYSKRSVPPDQNWPSRIHDLPLVEDINELTRKSPITPTILLLNLHQMYSKPSRGRFQPSARIIDCLSLADRVGHYDYSSAAGRGLGPEIQSEIAIRGSMCNLPPSLYTCDGKKYKGSTPWPAWYSNQSEKLILQEKLHFFEHLRNQKDTLNEAKAIRDNLFPFYCRLDSLFVDLLPVMQLNTPSYTPSDDEERQRENALASLIDLADRIRRQFDDSDADNLDEQFDEQFDDQEMQE